MKASQIEAMAWLRWRLAINTLNRSGRLNKILTAVVALSAVVISIALFLTSLIAGTRWLPQATPHQILLLWDGLVLAFILTWTLGLISELQRSDALSLDKFLHLPVSLKEAFLCNYLGSFISLSILVFLPAMAGLTFALQAVKGPAIIVLYPLIAGFLLMTTALTYRFQGWLATLMRNKRQRNTAVALITVAVILLFQLPNLINIAYQRTNTPTETAQTQRMTDASRLTDRLNDGSLSREQYAIGLEQIEKAYSLSRQLEQHQTQDRLVQAVHLGNVLFPGGWLPYGAHAAAQGRVWPAILGIIGTFAIGLISLQRSYVTTVRYFKSASPRGEAGQRQPANPTRVSPPHSRPLLVEQSLPWLSPKASAISFAYLRSLLRAPEAKLLLLTPLIILMIFGAMILTGGHAQISVEFRPFLALGTIGMALFSILQLIQNQFGLDRDGFRNYILVPARRHEVLLGKNMGIAPIALTIGIVALVALQAAMPLKTMHLAASFLQLISIYLLLCLMGNQVSIRLPIRMASGSMRPAKRRPTVLLIQILLICCSPLALIPGAIAMTAELWASQNHRCPGAPIYLALSAIQLTLVILLYHWTLVRQGRLLHRHQEHILQAVTEGE